MKFLDYMTSGLLHRFAVYRWPWKYDADIPLLCNLVTGPVEQNNLIAECPDKVRELKTLVDHWEYDPDSNIPDIAS